MNGDGYILSAGSVYLQRKEKSKMSVDNGQKSVIEIFKNMEMEEEKNTKSTEEPKTYKNHIKDIIEDVVEARKDWSKLSYYNRWRKFNLIEKILRKNSQLNSNYFKFFDILVDETSSEIILIIFDDYYYSETLLSAIVSLALKADCAIIVESAREEVFRFKDVLSKAGLPEEIFSIVSDASDVQNVMEITRIIYVGNKIKAMKVYEQNLFQTVSIVNLNQTAAILLESCDIQSAVDKIMKLTWGMECDALWGVSTIVVQESIYEKFLKQCEFQLKNFIPDKNNPKFNDKFALQHLDNLVKEAKGQGAKILGANESLQNEWSPKFLLNYQNVNCETLGGVICVLICRTPKEGITLLNNNFSFISISIWTELHSQALEIASMATCNHIWINSHGLISAFTPFHFSNFFIGNLMHCQKHFTKIQFYHEIETNKEKCVKELNIPHETLKMMSFILASSQKAFESWKKNRDKYTCLENIQGELKKKQSPFYKEVFDEYNGDTNFLNDVDEQNYYIIQKLVPLGIIVIYLIDESVPCDLVRLISSALINGNALILIAYDSSDLKIITDVYNKHLPKNLIQVIKENQEDAIYFFAGNPNVQDFWALGDYETYDKNLSLVKLKSQFSMNKTFNDASYFVPCKSYRTKVIWLSNRDQFP